MSTGCNKIVGWSTNCHCLKGLISNVILRTPPVSDSSLFPSISVSISSISLRSPPAGERNPLKIHKTSRPPLPSPPFLQMRDLYSMNPFPGYQFLYQTEFFAIKLCATQLRNTAGKYSWKIYFLCLTVIQLRKTSPMSNSNTAKKYNSGIQ